MSPQFRLRKLVQGSEEAIEVERNPWQNQVVAGFHCVNAALLQAQFRMEHVLNNKRICIEERCHSVEVVKMNQLFGRRTRCVPHFDVAHVACHHLQACTSRPVAGRRSALFNGRKHNIAHTNVQIKGVGDGSQLA